MGYSVQWPVQAVTDREKKDIPSIRYQENVVNNLAKSLPSNIIIKSVNSKSHIICSSESIFFPQPQQLHQTFDQDMLKSRKSRSILTLTMEKEFTSEEVQRMI